MTLIGIAGPKRSGKNTLAAGLCVALGLEEHSFAGPLRRFVADLLGLTLPQLELCKESEIPWLGGTTPRAMMQTVGTEWGRQMVHPNLWVDSLFARLPEQGAIISDVRFDNEAAAILERDGIVIRLSRPGTGQGDGHASERPVSDHLVTVDLCNAESPEVLIARALACLPTFRPLNPPAVYTGD